MLEFEKQLIITGAEQKIRKDGTTYTLVHTMGENGQTFASVFKGDVNKIMSLKKMEIYKIRFDLSIGQYTRLSIIDISK